jgi:hypothetical protein
MPGNPHGTFVAQIPLFSSDSGKCGENATVCLGDFLPSYYLGYESYGNGGAWFVETMEVKRR